MKFKALNHSFLFIFFSLLSLSKSQDYLDLDEDILNHILEDVKLRKCNCDVDEVFVNKTCFPAGQTTVPLLLFHDIIEPFLANTSSFHVIKNSGMKCGFNKYLTKINPRDLFILTTGELLHIPSNVSYSPFEFCVDHILSKEKEVIWEVQMCIEPLEVPVCCPYKPDKNRYCKNLALPIGFGFSLLKDAVIATLPGENIQCSENETLTKTEISDPTNPSSSVYINYNKGVTELIVYPNSDNHSLPKYLNSDEFCIIPEVKRKKLRYKASFCAKDPILEHQIFCKDFSCVRKCCPNHMLYSFMERGCIPYNETFLWIPTFQQKNDSREVEAPDNLKMSFGFPICKRNYYIFKPHDPKDDHILLDNGEMYVFHWGISVSSPRYCMDNFLSKSNEITQRTLTCFPDKERAKTQCSKVKILLYPILLVISCVFLLITLIVYASLPELHAKLHGKSLLSHVTALFVAYFVLAINKWSAKNISMGVCKTMAFIIHISFLSSFFWLNVMCFDIWWTLRSMRPVAETSDTFRRRFVYYSIYAWGCPLIISIVTITMEMFPETYKYGSHVIFPGFGRRDCWFNGDAPMWLYFYGFVSILTLANLIFFICVAIILIQAQRANNGILRTTTKQNKERVWIYLKLFIVMGITWICEVISWQEGSCNYWVLTDITNALQGFFIFLIFICKKNIFAKLRSRGSDSTRKLKRMVQGSSSYGSSSQVTQQSSLDSSRKFSSSLHYHLAKLTKPNVTEAIEVKE